MKKPKTISKLKKEAWDAFSVMIRVLYSSPDGYVTCYTCGKRMYWTRDGAQAGHFNQGRGNADLFDTKQVRVQCYQCNVCHYGEQHAFGEKLRSEIGEDVFQQIKKNKHKPVKYSRKDYIEMITDFKDKTELLIQYKNFTI